MARLNIQVGEFYIRYSDEMLHCLREVSKEVGATCYEFRVVELPRVHEDEMRIYRAKIYDKAGAFDLRDVLKPATLEEWQAHVAKALQIVSQLDNSSLVS